MIVVADNRQYRLRRRPLQLLPKQRVAADFDEPDLARDKRQNSRQSIRPSQSRRVSDTKPRATMSGTSYMLVIG
jgi:hypothetical protein